MEVEAKPHWYYQRVSQRGKYQCLVSFCSCEKELPSIYFLGGGAYFGSGSLSLVILSVLTLFAKESNVQSIASYFLAYQAG
jgi:hypothetical protein